MAVIVSDAFNRTLPTSWGSADVGGAYAEVGSGAKAVSGGLGTLAMSAATPGRPSEILAVPATDAISVAIVSTDVNAAGGDNIVRLLLRAGTCQYSVEFSWRATANWRIRLTKTVPAVPPATGNVTTALATFVGPAVATGGVNYTVKGEVLGVNPTTLRGKVWLTDTEIEPVAWSATITDAEPALQSAGNLGFDFDVAATSTAGTVTFRVDNWQVDGAGGLGAALSGSSAGTATALGTLTTAIPLSGTSAGVATASGTLGSAGPVIWLRDTFTRIVLPPEPPPVGGFGIAAAPPESAYYTTSPANRMVVYDGVTRTQTLSMQGSPTIDGQVVPWGDPTIQKIIRNTTFRDIIASGSGIAATQCRNVLVYGGTFDNIRKGSPTTPFPGHGIDARGGTAAIPCDDFRVVACTFIRLGVDGIQWGGGSSEFNDRWWVEYNEFYGPGNTTPKFAENAMDVKGERGPIVMRGNIIDGFRPCDGPTGGQDCSGSQGTGVTIHSGGTDPNATGIARNVTLLGNLFRDNSSQGALVISSCDNIDVGAGNRFEGNSQYHIYVHAGPSGATNVRVSSQQTYVAPGQVDLGGIATQY